MIRDDPRTVPALIRAAASDASPDVRSTILMRLHRFENDRMIAVLRSALLDADEEVRWAARYSLDQLGVDE